ncbi:D-alanyl-D-alanine carboxypeptidase [Streptomyces sp. NBC_01341]|uniref:D-alanyl-D-alanine carboxypeptidase n=1 Tax=Streptomyces sp. NBC_01341 TaxID=2903831 RepID=UPI002E149E3D|nr:D-alanyl-D-alanine carboxypeptidase [Streptomyces sp. NBC_01341]
MAGESPDKSEQRKSSGTTEERDPRLAVFREPVAAAGGGTRGGTAGAGADGETDTRTAVFRVPRSADAGPSEDVSAVGSAPAGSLSEGDAEPGESPTASKGSGEAPEGRTEAEEAAEAEEGAEGAAEPPTARTDAQESGTEESAVEPDAADAADPSGPSSGTSDDESEVKTEAAASEPDVEAEADGPAPTDARLRAAVAAWVSGDDEAADGDGPADGDSGTAAAPAAAEPEAEDEPEAEGEADVEAEKTDDEAADDATASEPAVADTSAAVTASDDAPRVPKSREESSPAEKPEKADKAEKSDEAEKAEKAEATENPEKVEKADSADDERGIDHPTAVFKAPRVDRVDQPTTALKLPSKKKETGSKSAPGSPAATGRPGTPKPSRTPETPAERTSRFVPLRSDDVRPAPPVVGPTVTPDISAGAAAPAGTRPALTEAERTRQQPMPPKPPLDLLAELTNTPPPVETPVRTAVRRVKIWTPLLLLALIIFAIAQAVRPLPDPALTLSADPTFTFGGDKLDMPWPEEGQGAVEVEGVGTIGSYGKEESAPIASVAKIMTAYVILQGHPITGKQNGERIEVDAKAGEEANRPDESTAPIKEGQKYTERQMLQLLMIPSGNNVARLLARWDATTEKAFVEKMNAAAKDLGMTNSVYTDPSGLESTTRSTPADQLKLARAVTRNDVFRDIVNMPQADIPGIGKTIYNNNNILLEPGVSGIKTGSSTPAGGNLVWTAETVVDGKTRRIIGAVMGADLDGTLDAKLQRAIHNSLELIQTAQKGVDSATVVKKGQVVGYVDNGFGVRTPVVATKDLKAVGWGGLEVKLDLSAGDEPLKQAAKAGTVVGQVTVGTGTGKVTAPVALQDGMTEPGFNDKLTRIT